MKNSMKICSACLLLSFSSHLFGETMSFQEGSGVYTNQTDLCINSSGGIWSSDERIAMDASPRYQTLIIFDDIFGEGSNQVPMNADIEYAAIKLKTANRISGYSGTTDDIDIYRINVPWTESSRWNDFSIINDTIGAKAVSTLIGTYSNTIVNGETTSLEITTAAQMWIADPSTNHGILFVNEGNDGCDFWSDASPNVAERPILEIRYVIRPVISTIRITDTGVELAFMSQLAYQYQVQYCPDLLATNWFDLGDSTAGDGTTSTNVDSTAGSVHSRFYRIVVTPDQ
ncbi:MAG: DNRLRE domain-containing protein [Kiritimatiellales bacterium]|nr:DNRLRE domain-containing protein [Kiritimatiellales bacterium]